MTTKLFSILMIISLIMAGCGAKPVTGDEVVSAFKAAGLEAENTRPLTKDDYGFAPFVCEGTRFLIPSLGEDEGGRIFICNDDKERDSIAAYYDELGKASAAFFSWVFVKDTVLVQISGDLPEDKARQYEAAIP